MMSLEDIDKIILKKSPLSMRELMEKVCKLDNEKKFCMNMIKEIEEDRKNLLTKEVVIA